MILLIFTLDFCPDMDREAVRAIGGTDSSPFMESTVSHWATVSAWSKDAADLGDAEEFGDGDEAVSENKAFYTIVPPRYAGGRKGFQSNHLGRGPAPLLCLI